MTLPKWQNFFKKNNYFEFNRKVKKQTSLTDTGIKFAPLYTCIWTKRKHRSFFPFHYIDDVFLFRLMGKET